MGFTQRQAAGKFTRDEAAAFIVQLEDAESPGAPTTPRPPSPRAAAAEQVLRRVPAEQLAAELQGGDSAARGCDPGDGAHDVRACNLRHVDPSRLSHRAVGGSHGHRADEHPGHELSDVPLRTGERPGWGTLGRDRSRTGPTDER